MPSPYDTFVGDVVRSMVDEPAGSATKTDAGTPGSAKPDAGTPDSGNAVAVAVESPVYSRGGRDFRLGDVRLNSTAARDILSYEVLFTGFAKGETDQLHIVVPPAPRGTMSQLGYEISHQDAFDPFRWNKLRQIIDIAHLDIYAVKSDQTIKVKRVNDDSEQIIETSLIANLAGGLTLPRKSIHKARGATTFGASTNDDRDQIYYSSEVNGRGPIGENSLAHELFGHLWLSLQGVPWQHPEGVEQLKRRLKHEPSKKEQADARVSLIRFGTLRREHGISDPLGFPFEGLVEDYIHRYAAAGSSAVQSPTQGVSREWLERANTRLWKALNGSGLIDHPGKAPEFSSELVIGWAYVGNNYEVSQYSPDKFSESILKPIIQWYRDNPPKQNIFQNFLRTMASRTDRPTRLASDTLTAIRLL